jgi:hypothetical protein
MTQLLLSQKKQDNRERELAFDHPQTYLHPQELSLSVSEVFGTSLSVVRHKRAPKKNGEDGTVFVISAIDLVMVARGCDYKTAQQIIFRIFRDYYKVDLEAEADHVNNHVEVETACLHFYVVHFCGQGQKKTLALDVQRKMSCARACWAGSVPTPNSDAPSTARSF